MDAPKQLVEEIMAKCHADSPLWDEVELRPWVESKQQFDPNLIQARSFTPVDYLAVARAIRCPTLLLTANPRKGALVTPAVAK